VDAINIEETVYGYGDFRELIRDLYAVVRKKCLKKRAVQAFWCVRTLKNRQARWAYGSLFHCRVCVLKKRNRLKIEYYKNLHAGERCFIVGTGPSLTIEDVKKLKGSISIGVNTLYKLFHEADWKSDYYCIIDPDTYENIKDELSGYKDIPLFYAENRLLDKNVKGIPFELNCSDFYRLKAPDVFSFTSFSPDLDKYIYDGASVVYAALEIAVYMGFKEIYLLGVDCNYELSREALHNSKLSYSKDYNYNWTRQTGLTMIEGFKVAKAYADEHGIKIFNATRGGMLEVFPRVNLDDVVMTERENDTGYCSMDKTQIVI
jgi:hypothetical protein